MYFEPENAVYISMMRAKTTTNTTMTRRKRTTALTMEGLSGLGEFSGMELSCVRRWAEWDRLCHFLRAAVDALSALSR